jgi:hypothetical protein
MHLWGLPLWIAQSSRGRGRWNDNNNTQCFKGMETGDNQLKELELATWF